jgi:hypothetical protein
VDPAGDVDCVPLGAAKWMTLPSSLNILTSSMAWIGCTFSFFSEVCNFLSSVPDDLWTFLVLRRGVPLPLHSHLSELVPSRVFSRRAVVAVVSCRVRDSLSVRCFYLPYTHMLADRCSNASLRSGLPKEPTNSVVGGLSLQLLELLLIHGGEG